MLEDILPFVFFVVHKRVFFFFPSYHFKHRTKLNELSVWMKRDLGTTHSDIRSRIDTSINMNLVWFVFNLTQQQNQPTISFVFFFKCT